MAKKNKAVTAKFKKDFQKQLEDKLASIVESLNQQIGEKKLQKRLRRAGKIIAKGIKPVQESKSPAENTAS
jgi:predicted ArsR family transcriptional regulator